MSACMPAQLPNDTLTQNFHNTPFTKSSNFEGQMKFIQCLSFSISVQCYEKISEKITKKNGNEKTFDKNC